MHPEIILAMSIDAIIEEARKDANKNNKYTLIGKKYTVKDNSFASELVEGKRLDYHVGLIGVPVTIVSKPYLTTITKPVIGSVRRRMIQVKSIQTGLVYEVIFREDWICN